MTFRSRVRDHEELLGVFLNLGSPVAAEMAGLASFDWALIDLEHGAASEAGLLPHLTALGMSGTPSIVRVESAARPRIGRALDLGAAGVMVPQVNGAALARDVASWLRYPPTGVRGIALSARGAGFGATRHGEVAELDEAVVGIAQVETGAAVQDIDEIAEVDGLDVLFVGPTDLSHSIGVPGRFDDPAFDRAIRRIADAAVAHGRALGVHLPAISELDRYRRLGFSLISITSDGAALVGAFRSALAAARARIG